MGEIINVDFSGGSSEEPSADVTPAEVRSVGKNAGEVLYAKARLGVGDVTLDDLLAHERKCTQQIAIFALGKIWHDIKATPSTETETLEHLRAEEVKIHELFSLSDEEIEQAGIVAEHYDFSNLPESH